MEPPPNPRRSTLFTSWIGFVAAAAGAIVMLWFLQKIVVALLVLFMILVVSIALSAPVRWLVRRGLSRRLAAVLVIATFFAVLALLGWLVIPEVAQQIGQLVERLPSLIAGINQQIADLFVRYPDLQQAVRSSGVSPNVGPAFLNLFRGVGDFSLGLLGALALTIIFLSGVVNVVLDPQPILRAYLGSLPVEQRRAGMRAYRRASRSVVGWTEAALILGTIESILVFVVLSLLDIPGALVWAALAFFAEFIPRIGNYIMAIPPVLVALTLGPMTALWVALFYYAMGELLGTFVQPRIGGATMNLHPLMLIFFALAFALAFGLLGAIAATPAAAFFSAYYSEFYMKRPLRRDER